ncbi:kelch-like protein 34 [Carassius auratus]|uniref:Kelch-like protein 34 n=2 Tax=Carassius TaxID=7956 RepID=A0A6P6MAI6_CARAU|nr:kelch-like protein 34 [Carassius auratus]UZH44939.1 kelch-like protein [Carassius gibelio]WEX30324.1 Kelch-like protein 34-A [Carassius gibelio]
MNYYLMLSNSHGEGVLSRYQSLRLEGRMCDVVLEAEGVEFPAHRTLLACSSDYFWSVFKDYNLESGAHTISLPALSSLGLEQILDFVYTSWISLSPSTLEVTLQAACYLQITHAVELCTQYISESIAPDNCCFFANIAARYGLSDAFNNSNSFIGSNMCRILASEEHKAEIMELNIDSLQEVLIAEEMPGVKEIDLLQLALDWLECNPQSALHSNALLSRIRFGLIPPKELSQLSALKPALRTPFIQSVVQKALNYHLQGPLKPLLQSVHTSLRATKSKILLVGGGPEANRPQNQILAYEPHSKKFQPLSASLPNKLQHQGVCVVGNFLFVLGGEVVQVDEENEKSAVMTVTNQVWRYDPRFGQWEEMEPLLQKRAQFACCVVEGVIFAFGGGGQRGEPALSSVEMYNMSEGCWRSAVSLPYSVHGHACTTIGTGIYISGGIHVNSTESSKEVLFLNAFEGDAWQRRSNMSIARFGHQMATVRGRIYTFLGMYEHFCDIERYSPEQDLWTRLKPLLNDRFCYGLTTTEGRRVLMFGGRKWQEGQEVCTTNVLEYDTEYDAWREVCKLPGPLCGIQCAIMTLQDPPET